MEKTENFLVKKFLAIMIAKFYYRVYEKPTPDSVLSLASPFHSEKSLVFFLARMNTTELLQS